MFINTSCPPRWASDTHKRQACPLVTKKKSQPHLNVPLHLILKIWLLEVARENTKDSLLRKNLKQVFILRQACVIIVVSYQYRLKLSFEVGYENTGFQNTGSTENLPLGE